MSLLFLDHYFDNVVKLWSMNYHALNLALSIHLRYQLPDTAYEFYDVCNFPNLICLDTHFFITRCAMLSTLQIAVVYLLWKFLRSVLTLPYDNSCLCLCWSLDFCFSNSISCSDLPGKRQLYTNHQPHLGHWHLSHFKTCPLNYEVHFGLHLTNYNDNLYYF